MRATEMGGRLDITILKEIREILLRIESYLLKQEHAKELSSTERSVNRAKKQLLND
jgi:hypothetical protein|tara:strand:- start:350 stop:517 length:168 start_codon:yes stop_codon:yes gene_type:complete